MYRPEKAVPSILPAIVLALSVIVNIARAELHTGTVVLLSNESWDFSDSTAVPYLDADLNWSITLSSLTRDFQQISTLAEFGRPSLN